jgi:hypothetical protein
MRILEIMGRLRSQEFRVDVCAHSGLSGALDDPSGRAEATSSLFGWTRGFQCVSCICFAGDDTALCTHTYSTRRA